MTTAGSNAGATPHDNVAATATPAAGAPAVAYTYVHHPVSTNVPAAQAAFDRGLTLVFAYQRQEAEQAFRQAAQLDPALAMAWWGIGLSVGPDINMPPTPQSAATGAEALERAAQLAGMLGAATRPALNGAEHPPAVTRAEQDYITALSARYTAAADPDFDRLATGYRDAMRDLVQKYPSDADARALFAEAIMDVHPWRLWRASGEPETGTPELIEDLERGLSLHPDHIGLLHFYIHAVEASPAPGRALAAARRLAAQPMEPAASHLVHMPAHIYMRVGDSEAAVEANEHATHHALDFRISADPKVLRACGHCADFLSYAYMMQGNEAHARQSAGNYEKMTGDPSNSLAVLVRFNKWDEALSFPEPAPEAKPGSRDPHVLRGLWHFARGLAFVGTKQIAQGHEELTALQSEARKAPPEARFDGPPDVQHVNEKISQSADAIDLRIAAAILGSRIAEAEGRIAEATRLMRVAVRLQDDMPYSEPPPWFFAVRESLGALLLRHAAAAEAEAVFRECLRRSPNNPRALFGLAAALQADGHRSEAQREHTLFETAWHYSDRPLTLNDF